MSSNNVKFTFNKNNEVNLSKFDGASKEELSKKVGDSENKKKLLGSIFGKYDTNKDGVLSKEEFKVMQNDLQRAARDNNLSNRELKKFNKETLGVDKQAYSMDDMQSVIKMMTDDSDSITNVKENGEKTSITYKPDQNGNIKTFTYKNNNGKLYLLAEDVKNGDTNTHYEYVDGNNNKFSKIVETKDGAVTTTLFEDDGHTWKSKTRQKGAVTETLDFNNYDRVLERVTDKGNEVKETVKYEYADDGSVTETTYDDGVSKDKPAKIVKKDSEGKTTETTDYKYEDGKTTETVTVGEGENATRTRTVKDGAGNIENYVNVDEKGEVQPLEYKVKAGDTWYGIVQAKYGITDHKTTMEIVHKLKDAAGISYSAKTMPKDITLPAKVDLADGKSAELKNIDALVNMKHGVDTALRITPPANLTKEQIPAKIAPLTDDQKQITIPKYDVNTGNAGEIVKQNDGSYFQYDDAGRVIRVYKDDAAKNADNNSIYIKYDDNGNINVYQKNTYDENGRWTGGIDYDGSGKFAARWKNDNFNGNGESTRKTYYNADGSVKYVTVNSEYNNDNNGRTLSYDSFNADGTWASSIKLDYDNNNGTCQTRYYEAKDKGKLTKFENFG